MFICNLFCSPCLLFISSSIFQVHCSPLRFLSLLAKVRSFSSSKLLIPQVIYADDDDLIDPGVNTLIDYSTHDRLDGQFEDITSSTRIIEPNL